MFWLPGVNGLLGTALARLCKTKQIPFIGTTRQEIDLSQLTDVQKWLDAHPTITHIINCAAYSLVDAAETEKEKAWQANVIGPENLARVAREKKLRLLHLSSDYVFEGKLLRPLKEEDPAEPVNHYGVTKREGEIRVFKECPWACVLRVSWLFGEGGKNLVAKLLHLMQEKKELQLTDDQWGRPTYVKDLAEVLLLLQDREGLYQFANAGVTTKYHFGKAMHEEAIRLQLPIVTEKIVPVPSSTFPSVCVRPIYSAFDTTKIEREVSIIPRPWQQTLHEFMEIYAQTAKTSC